MKLVSAVLTALALGLLAGPLPALAQPAAYRLIPNNSRATFKSDAPLETIVGNTSAEGVQGEVMLDPARPQATTGQVRVDLASVRTGVDKRDADMRGKNYLDTDTPANRWAVFDLKGVDMAGPLEVGKALAARLRGTLTIKQRPAEVVASGTVTYVKLTPEQLEGQKRFGFTADNVKVRVSFGTTFANHGIQVPQILLFKVANDVHLEADVTLTRVQ